MVASEVRTYFPLQQRLQARVNIAHICHTPVQCHLDLRGHGYLLVAPPVPLQPAISPQEVLLSLRWRGDARLQHRAHPGDGEVGQDEDGLEAERAVGQPLDQLPAEDEHVVPEHHLVYLQLHHHHLVVVHLHKLQFRGIVHLMALL